MIIIDTDIVSLLRRAERYPSLSAWTSRTNDADVFLTVVTRGEVERGIERQRRINPEFAAHLSDWARQLDQIFRGRILDFDQAAALVWGRLTAQHGHSNADLLIAAIALSHNATLVTRNMADFAWTGVRIENPFA